ELAGHPRVERGDRRLPRLAQPLGIGGGPLPGRQRRRRMRRARPPEQADQPLELLVGTDQPDRQRLGRLRPASQAPARRQDGGGARVGGGPDRRLSCATWAKPADLGRRGFRLRNPRRPWPLRLGSETPRGTRRPPPPGSAPTIPLVVPEADGPPGLATAGSLL